MNENKKVAILDYGSGNVKSVYNIIEYLGYSVEITNDPKIIENSSHLILPGVGSYAACVNKVDDKIGFNFIKKIVFEKKKPFLGICVGVQLLASKGFEHGESLGLNLISGIVNKINTLKLPIPHVGWNEINIKKKNKLMDEIPDKTDFYFVHSYKFETDTNESIIATSNYENEFPSIINKDNIYGVQFHPEKSQTYGIKLINNFIKNIN